MTAVKQGYFDMMAAPLRVGTVTLRVRDLAKLSDFYQKIMGLQLISETPQEVRLGVAGQVLLILEGNPSFKPLDPREAGLFHTAFLMPDRRDLGAWLRHAAGRDLRLEGRVAEVDFLGSVIRLRVEVGGQRVSADIFNRPDAPPPQVGSQVVLSAAVSDLIVLER